MNPSEFITFSGTIAGSGKAGARSAVSRAYYGAFHFALTVLDGIGCTVPQNGTSHALAPNFLKCSSSRNARTAASLLSDLLSDRIQADYHLNNTDCETKAFAETAIATAEKIAMSLTAFKADCAAPNVLDEFAVAVRKAKDIRKMA